MNILNSIQRPPPSVNPYRTVSVIPVSNPLYNFVSTPNSLSITATPTTQQYAILNGSYTVSTSSSYNNDADSIHGGFNYTFGGFWVCRALRYSQSTGAYLGSNSLGGRSGEWAKVRCPNAFVPSSYGFFLISSTNQIFRKHYFFGSTDGTSWTVLSTYETDLIGYGVEVTVPLTTTNAYNWYAVVINQISRPEGGSISGEFNLRLRINTKILVS